VVSGNVVYEQVVEAYIMSGLEDRLAAGGEIARIGSVGSCFISRIDSPVDSRVSAPLQGKVGIASAKVAHARFGQLFGGEPWQDLRARGVGEIRVLVRDRLHVATCVGFGPRFQHSTGQAYKGGPNSGVFLQLTCENTIELPVPGHHYTFGVVKEAQARGDFDALAASGRRGLRIDIGADPTAGLTALRDATARILRNATPNRAEQG